MAVPKIIHYCWLSGGAIPDNLNRCMESWKKHLPEYEFILWDLNKFDINSSLWVKQAFENKKYAFAADYIRLYAVYNYGGIYMDMDVEVVKPFAELHEREYILAFEDSKGTVEAGCFGAEKNAPWLEKCLEYYKNREFIKDGGGFDITPLPQTLKNIFRKNNFEFNMLPPEALTAKSYETGKIKVTENTYTIHHFAGSWLTKRQKVKIRLVGALKNLFGEERYIKIKKILGISKNKQT